MHLIHLPIVFGSLNEVIITLIIGNYIGLYGIGKDYFSFSSSGVASAGVSPSAVSPSTGAATTTSSSF
ncbi:MAG: hypothetical protein US14_C0047G0007 [candidate division WS6 bacterium GW2011_WS6_36_26]|nr:MAG: hypothetical protein US14_C0047G0007 [candidate division WS6 bacterium GW2011_WS6_36_26]